MWVLAGASFFAGYDVNVLTTVLPQVRHTFGLSQAQASDWLALLFLGALPAVFLARRAGDAQRARLRDSGAGMGAFPEPAPAVVALVLRGRDAGAVRLCVPAPDAAGEFAL
jgi:hypothetical protein